MQLLVVRHADAGDAEEFAKTGKDDSLRPLSPKGRKQMRQAADALRAFVPDVTHIATSPLVRAVQTTAILHKAYGRDVTVLTTDVLEPHRAPAEFTRWLERQDVRDTLAIVGHEPHLGILATWLLSGQDESRIELKKGGACLLEFDDAPARNRGTLRWLLTPKQLRRLAD